MPAAGRGAARRACLLPVCFFGVFLFARAAASCDPQRYAAQFAALRRPLWAGTIGVKTTFLKIFRIVNIRGHKELNKTITFVAIVKVKGSISRF